MASRLRLRPDLPPLRRGRDAVQLGLSATAGGIVVEGLAPAEVALIEHLDGPLGGALRPTELYAAAAELGVADARAVELVTLLRTHGVLVDAGPREPPPRRDGPWVVVDGRGPLTAAVAGLLRATATARVDVGPWAADVADAELREPRPPGLATVRDAPRVSLVVVVTRGPLHPAAGECWRTRRVPLLPVLDDGGRVLVGPLVTSDPVLPCLRCLQLTRVERDAHWPEVMAQAVGSTSGWSAEAPGGPGRPAAAVSVAAGVVAMVADLALTDPGRSGNGVSVEVGGPWPRLDHRRWSRHPACPAHGGQRGSGAASEAPAEPLAEPSGGPSSDPSRRPSAGSGVEPGPLRVTMTG